METINVFISYAKKDFKLVEKLIKKDLKSNYFTRNKVRFKLNIWWDYHLLPSENWRKQIIENIEDCDLFICILTENFMSSNFILNTEIPLAKKRFENTGVGILGILYEECEYKKLIIKDLQLIPQMNGRLKPISKWRPKKNAVELVINGLKTASVISYGKLPKLLKDANLNFSKKGRKLHRIQFLDKKEQRNQETGDRLNRRIINNNKSPNSFKIPRRIKRYLKFFVLMTSILLFIIFLVKKSI